MAQKFLDGVEHYTNDYRTMYRTMYQFAIDNELCDVVTELASFEINGKNMDGEGWVIYKDERLFVIDEHNKNVDLGDELGYHDFDEISRAGLEWCGSEPRIGGYPDKIIRSYNEMVQFMKDGFKNADVDQPRHYTFTLEEDRRERVMNNIKRFFETYPKGIITFG